MGAAAHRPVCGHSPRYTSCGAGNNVRAWTGWWPAPASVVLSPMALPVPLDQSNHGKEMMMSTKENPAQGSAAPVEPPKKFRDMNFKQKLAHVCKAVTCLVTFGFAYPNIFID